MVKTMTAVHFIRCNLPVHTCARCCISSLWSSDI